MHQVQSFLAETTARALPRILTQICRDPGCPSYGACDRNWWHYKIHDFPSIILQQAGYTLHLASTLPGWDFQPKAAEGKSCLHYDAAACAKAGTQTPNTGHNPQNPDFTHLAAATARFWNQRATLHGAFEEYYPYEQGYPPLAFSTLSVAKLCHTGVIPLSDIRNGLSVAAHQLQSRFEAQAANQQIAGIAALAVIRSIAPDLIQENTFQSILTQSLSLQHEEGWFPEYDGPDLGYLSVSIDCLYDLLDHTNDSRILPAIRKAADFIAWFALSPFGTAGMQNSRNTDYITPYGLVRLAIEEQHPRIKATVAAVFNRHSHSGDPQSPIPNLKSSFHSFDSIDDRYWCHYIGHSVFRALHLLETTTAHGPSTEVTNHQPQITNHYPGSGHALLTSPAGASALISPRKGSIATAVWPEGSKSFDYGWVIQTPKKQFVTHWWSTDWNIDVTSTSVTCEGWLVAHTEHHSTPAKHILLRIASFILGRHLIPVLKRLVIFKVPHRTHHFRRVITWEKESLVLTDTITGLSQQDTVSRAPRASKRHVASADSFHPEDFTPQTNAYRIEKVTRQNNTFTCETRYQLVIKEIF